MTRRPYKAEFPALSWWLRQPRYIRYMLREMSALFLGIYVLVLIAGLYCLSLGKPVYEQFLTVAEGPVGLTFAVITMFFAVYHTYTWFKVTPKAMPLTLRGQRLPGAVIIAAHWLIFALLSAAVWLLVSS